MTKIFCDLDDTLTNFEKQLNKALKYHYGNDHADYDPELYNKGQLAYKQHMWEAIDAFQKAGFQMWYELEFLPHGKELWEYIQPHRPEILSATGPFGHNAEMQKKRWVDRHLGEHVIVNLVRKAEMKANYASEGAILIDDKWKAITPWIKAGGIGIHFTSTEKTIKILQELNI